VGSSDRSGGAGTTAAATDLWSAQSVAQLPPPGLSGPTQPVFAPLSSRYLAFVSSASQIPRPIKVPTSSYRPLTSPLAGPAGSQTSHPNPYSTTPSTTAQNHNIKPSLSPGGVGSSGAAHVERMLMCLDLEQLTASPISASGNEKGASLAWPLLRIEGGDGSSNGDGSNGSRVVKRRFETSASGAAGGAAARAGSGSSSTDDLEERLRRERQRLSSGVTQFHWAWTTPAGSASENDQDEPVSYLRVLVPVRGSLLVQDGVLDQLRTKSATSQQPATPGDANSSTVESSPLSSGSTGCARAIHEQAKSPIDPQLSPDGTMVAWSCDGEIYVKSAAASAASPAVQITYGADPSAGLSHGVAEFVAQEEMDRYRGFWWHPSSTGILFTKVDESSVPVYRIVHHQHQTSTTAPSTVSSKSDVTPGGEAEDHRYPFAGKTNPVVRLGFVPVDRECIVNSGSEAASLLSPIVISEPSCLETAFSEAAASITSSDLLPVSFSDTALQVARTNWNTQVAWFEPPREASEYLCRVFWLEDENCVSAWQNRTQTALVLQRLDLSARKGRTLLIERSEEWINLHHMFCLLPPIHPSKCSTSPAPETSLAPASSVDPSTIPLPPELPPGSFSFLFASERTGFSHLYLYTFIPGINGEQALQLRAVSSGEWMVEQIVGADTNADWVYVTGTFDGPLERHLYALPITGRPRTPSNWKDRQSQISSSKDTPDVVMAVGDCMTSTASSATSMSCDESTLTTATPTPDSSQDHSVGSAVPASASNGVRRSLSKVMNALAGKSLVHQSTAGSATRDSTRGSSGVVSSLNTSSAASGANFGFDRAAASLSIVTARPIRLTMDRGMHSIVMDDNCRYFVDTSSDLDRPTSVKIYELESQHLGLVPPKLVLTLFDAAREDTTLARLSLSQPMTMMHSEGGSTLSPPAAYESLSPPEVISFPTSDGAEMLHGALYKPDPRMHGPGPYPLVCAVYGGPHVQRVNRSWSQCADMRAQRLRSLGFCVVKCDNRGSSRRGVKFEVAIHRNLGRLEVLDQVAAVRQLVMRGIADPNRVGVYGWSYGGYLAAMCLCRAPDVFHVGVAGAPVTSWDGYDTHYTERYMGLPSDNAAGYRESSVFEHVPNMRGKLLLVHGLIDENVHFRHTARLINKLIACGKDYDLLIFPDERHSPRRLRDRVYMEQRVSDFFQRHLMSTESGGGGVDLVDIASQGGIQGLRAMAGRL
jgi:poly(3-hydroxybutyrate) depolymerase